MTRSRLRLTTSLLLLTAIGCGPSTGKPITPPTPEQKAQLDKMHEEKKAEGQTPAPAN